MRILLVEDEYLLREQVQQQLSSHGYAVDCASDGEEALFLGEENDYDAAIIDLGLPKLDGVSVIERLRQQHRQFPILILTARVSWQDKVKGLEVGADDYLVKPFHPEELRARIHALIRRSNGHSQSLLTFGPISIDTLSKQVESKGQPIELTQFEYNTLEYLVLHSQQVISKTTLTEHLYQQDFDRDSNVIEVFITRLRKKLDPDGSLKPIATVRGLGYRFTLQEGA